MINIKTAKLSDLVLKAMQAIRNTETFQAMMKNPFKYSKLANSYNKFLNATNDDSKAGHVADMIDLVK